MFWVIVASLFSELKFRTLLRSSSTISNMKFTKSGEFTNAPKCGENDFQAARRRWFDTVGELPKRRHFEGFERLERSRSAGDSEAIP